MHELTRTLEDLPIFAQDNPEVVSGLKIVGVELLAPQVGIGCAWDLAQFCVGHAEDIVERCVLAQVGAVAQRALQEFPCGGVFPHFKSVQSALCGLLLRGASTAGKQGEHKDTDQPICSYPVHHPCAV